MKREKTINGLFLVGTAIFVLSILWLNFHSAQWYNFDMTADADVARLMAEQKTLFPKNWIFGNQFYVIATPALAALLYPLTHSSVPAMSVACTLLFLLNLGCFLWSFRGLFSRQALLAGMFCFAGACILGDSAASSTFGLQVLFTMAGYYSCYMLGILLHLGIWLRLDRDGKAPGWSFVVAFLMSFALGMQSLRETLVLFIPLILITAVRALQTRTDAQRKSVLFAVASLLVNLGGVLLMHFGSARWILHQDTNISLYPSGARLTEFPAHLRETGKAVWDILGFRYLSYGWKWKPIAVLGLFFLCVVLFATFRKKSDRDTLRSRLPLQFCWLSFGCVFAAGALVMSVRGIYFFVWYLTVPLGVSALVDGWRSSVPKRAAVLCVLVLGAGALGYVFNFYPDFSGYRTKREFCADLVSWMEERDIRMIYGDYQAPTIVACSGDTIDFCSVFPDVSAEEEEDLLMPYVSPVATDGYEKLDPQHSVLVLSDSPYDSMSGYRYLENYAPPEFRDRFEATYRLEECFASPFITYYIYSFPVGMTGG